MGDITDPSDERKVSGLGLHPKPLGIRINAITGETCHKRELLSIVEGQFVKAGEIRIGVRRRYTRHVREFCQRSTSVTPDAVSLGNSLRIFEASNKHKPPSSFSIGSDSVSRRTPPPYLKTEVKASLANENSHIGSARASPKVGNPLSNVGCRPRLL